MNPLAVSAPVAIILPTLYSAQRCPTPPPYLPHRSYGYFETISTF
jgi:hypothetical protein